MHNTKFLYWELVYFSVLFHDNYSNVLCIIVLYIRSSGIVHLILNQEDIVYYTNILTRV